jgi:hypothetical protein
MAEITTAKQCIAEIKRLPPEELKYILDLSAQFCIADAAGVQEYLFRNGETHDSKLKWVVLAGSRHESGKKIKTIAPKEKTKYSNLSKIIAYVLQEYDKKPNQIKVNEDFSKLIPQKCRTNDLSQVETNLCTEDFNMILQSICSINHEQINEIINDADIANDSDINSRVINTAKLIVKHFSESTYGQISTDEINPERFGSR